AFAAYMTVVGTAALNLPFVAAAVVGVVATAALALGFDVAVWGPPRRRQANALQMLLAAIGLAFIIRHTIQLIAGTNVRTVGVDVTSTFHLGDVTIGRTQFWVVVVGYTVLLLLGLMLRYTMLGKQLRALSDDP